MSNNFCAILSIKLLLVLFSTNSICQTCVIAKIVNNTIFVGADTRFGQLSYIDNKKTFDTTYSIGCKIFNSGKYSFATIGVKTEEQRKFADSICRLNYSLQETLNTYTKIFSRRLANFLDWYRISDINTYNSFVRKPN